MVTKHSLKECLGYDKNSFNCDIRKKQKNSSFLVLFLYQVCLNYRLEPISVDICIREPHIQN